MKEMFKSELIVFLLAAIAIFCVSENFDVAKIVVPLLVVLSFAFVISKYRLRYIEYLLFFVISIAGLVGFTENLTGSHAESSNALLFGLSFYSASMAYLIAQERFTFRSVLSVSNPLLLSTGPIALFFQHISHKSLRKRVEYYFPFIIVVQREFYTLMYRLELLDGYEF